MKLKKLYGIWQADSYLPIPRSLRDGAINISLIDFVGGGGVEKMKD